MLGWANNEVMVIIMMIEVEKRCKYAVITHNNNAKANTVKGE